LNAEHWSYLVWLLPIGVSLGGLYQGVRFWAIRTQAYGAISGTILTQSATQSTAQIVGGLLISGPLGLMVGQVFGQAAGLFRLSRHACRTLTRVGTYSLQWRKLVPAATRYRRIALLSCPSALASTS